MYKEFRSLFLSKFFQRIGPQEIAHQSMCGRLPEAVDLAQVIKSVQLGRESTVNAEELLVHHSGQRERTE